MRSLFTKLLIINAIICAVFGAVFAVPIGRLEAGLIIGLAFGILTGLLVEVIFRRWRGQWLYRRRLLFLVLLEMILMLYLLMPAYLAYFGLRPARATVGVIPADLADAAEAVSIETPDGVTLAGWYIAPENGAAIIALHGFGSSRMEVLPHARMLIAAGYGVLTMDMRAHGASGGEIFADGWLAPGDVGAMVDHLTAKTEVAHIGGLGLSAGAVSILYGGMDNESIEAFVVEGTSTAAAADLIDPLTPNPAIAWLLVPDYWISYRFVSLFTGYTPAPPVREMVKQIAPRPMLFIAGEDSMWEPELAAKYAVSAGEAAQVWVIPRTGHIAGIRTMPEEYAARVTAFFDAAFASS